MSPSGRSERIGFLREAIARIEIGRPGEALASEAAVAAPRPLARFSLGGEGSGEGSIPLDRALGGGLARGSVISVLPQGPQDEAAACGFVFALAGLFLRRDPFKIVVWVTPQARRFEKGLLYAPGFAAYGVDPARFLLVHVAEANEALWALQTLFDFPAVGVVVGEWAGLPAKSEERLSTLCRRQQALARPDKPWLVFFDADVASGVRVQVSPLPLPPESAALRQLPQAPQWGLRLLRVPAGAGRLTDIDPERLYPVAFDPNKGCFRDALSVDRPTGTRLPHALGA